MNITGLFFEAAHRNPERVAIVHKDEQISYRELEAQVRQTMAYFEAKGIRKGDRVLVFVPMSIDLYRIVLALFGMGAVAVFLDEWVSKKRMEACCRVAQCKGFVGIAKARLLCWFSKELRRIPLKLSLKVMHVSKGVVVNCLPDDEALITFTTGSTGTPKAAKRTHGFLQEQFNALIEKINPKEGDADMSLLPIVLLINLGAGVTSVIAEFSTKKPHKFNPGRIVAQINEYKVNRITASPFFIKAIATHLLQKQILLKEVTQVFTGGAPVFPQEAKQIQEAFPFSEVEIVYGSTEAEPISSVNARTLMKEQILTEGLLVGKPYRKSEVRIIPIVNHPLEAASEAELRACALMENGEIIVAGPHVLREYLNNDEALKRNKIFIGDKVFHRTGDSGFLDAEGNLFLSGRCATLFECHGQTVYPFMYENYFQTLDGVVMGTVMQLYDELIVAIELTDTSKRAGVEMKLRQLPLDYDRLAFVKMPRDPRHHSKIDYEKLKELLKRA